MFSPQETQFFGAPSHQELEPRMINNDFVRVCLLVCFCSCLFLFLFVCFCMFLSNFCMVQYKFWCAFICAYLSSFQGSVFVLMLICVWICVNAYFPPHMALGDYCLCLFAFIFALGLAMGVSYFCLGNSFRTHVFQVNCVVTSMISMIFAQLDANFHLMWLR